MKEILGYAHDAWPILLGMAVYFVRLEVRLAKICTDLAWIKKGCAGCQQSSEENTD